MKSEKTNSENKSDKPNKKYRKKYYINQKQKKKLKTPPGGIIWGTFYQ